MKRTSLRDAFGARSFGKKPGGLFASSRVPLISHAVGRSRFAEKGSDVRSNLKCNLTPSHARDHSSRIMRLHGNDSII